MLFFISCLVVFFHFIWVTLKHSNKVQVNIAINHCKMGMCIGLYYLIWLIHFKINLNIHSQRSCQLNANLKKNNKSLNQTCCVLKLILSTLLEQMLQYCLSACPMRVSEVNKWKKNISSTIINSLKMLYL